MRIGITANFSTARKRLAQKLNNPRLLRITFHTIRHWKATMEYHKTRDIIHVKENILRHRSIENTMIYIHLEKAVFGTSTNDEYHVKTAKTVEEACELAKVGFDYFTKIDDVQIFRKRK
jgi:integrase